MINDINNNNNNYKRFTDSECNTVLFAGSRRSKKKKTRRVKQGRLYNRIDRTHVRISYYKYT